MKQLHNIDVHGHSVTGDSHDKNHDHFAIATLNKSMRVHQTNLSIDDDSRVHGLNQGHVFLVADGISGGPAPARASGTAIDSVVHYFLNEMPWYHLADGEPGDVILALDDALRNCQDSLRERGPDTEPAMGTTMTVAFVSWPHLYIAHVGDSRCYLFRRGTLRQLTTDHTLAQVRRDVGGRVTPGADHSLWNALGGADDALHPQVLHMTLEAGDRLALVTDGVMTRATPRRLRDVLDSDGSAEQLVSRLTQGSGGEDRTAIVVRFLPREPRESELAAPTFPPRLSTGRQVPEHAPDAGPDPVRSTQ